MADPVLSIRNLCVEIPTRHGILKPVDGVSYDIAKGEILGIVGESGAGKSKHPKSALQEWAAGNQRKPPEYEVVDRSGPDHAAKFTVRVKVHKVGEAQATAGSKGEAEKAAAKTFMEKYG